MFGNKKKCPNCGAPVKDDWNFCPYCGFELKGTELEEKLRKLEKELFNFSFSFADIDKEFERLEKLMRKQTKPIWGGSLSITMQSGTGMEPKIEIRTSGDFKKYEPELKKKLGVKAKVEEVETAKAKEAKEEEEKIEKEKAKRPIPKIAEEPEMNIKEENGKKILSISLPDVKSIKDIDIKKLEHSIEIRAFAGDKVYFKLIPIEGNIVSKKFKDSTLTLEIQ
ncbi:MAG: zinc ribbon domain-containing protein [Candidatus Micrarchaeales archaeon]